MWTGCEGGVNSFVILMKLEHNLFIFSFGVHLLSPRDKFFVISLLLQRRKCSNAIQMDELKKKPTPLEQHSSSGNELLLHSFVLFLLHFTMLATKNKTEAMANTNFLLHTRLQLLLFAFKQDRRWNKVEMFFLKVLSVLGRIFSSFPWVFLLVALRNEQRKHDQITSPKRENKELTGFSCSVLFVCLVHLWLNASSKHQTKVNVTSLRLDLFWQAWAVSWDCFPSPTSIMPQ